MITSAGLCCSLCGRQMLFWKFCVISLESKSHSYHKSETQNAFHVFLVGFEDLSCPYCGRQYSRKDALKVHIRDIHENQGKVFYCEICNKQCKTKSALNMHKSSYHRTQHLWYCLQISAFWQNKRMARSLVFYFQLAQCDTSGLIIYCQGRYSRVMNVARYSVQDLLKTGTSETNICTNIKMWSVRSVKKFSATRTPWVIMLLCITNKGIERFP